MKYLSEDEYKKTFKEPMQQATEKAEPPFDFWQYFENIPKEDYKNNDCSEGIVEIVYTNGDNSYQHVLINSTVKKIFMILVLDLNNSNVYGHRLLDFNTTYGDDH